jgi:hypothetical protein
MCTNANDINKIWSLIAKINQGKKIDFKEYEYLMRQDYPIKLVYPNIEEYVSQLV